MNHKRDLITDGPALSIQACDDGVWLHFTTLDGKLHCSLNLPVKFAKGTYLFDDVICQWAHDFAVKNQDAPQNTMEQNGHIAQQLKPEMPSFADVTKDVQFMTVDEGNKAFVVYSNIARHFGR